MSTSNTTRKPVVRNTAQVTGIHLQPTICADEAEVLEVAWDGFRRRPTLARNHDGQLVVCSSRTARKHGWKIEGKLFGDAPKPKAPKAEKPVKATPAAKRAERLAKLEEAQKATDADDLI